MEAVGTFFKDHWKVILIGLFGVALGVASNTVIRNIENKNLLASLTKGLKSLQEKAETTALTEDEKNKIEYLKGEIYILEFKCA